MQINWNAANLGRSTQALLPLALFPIPVRDTRIFLEPSCLFLEPSFAAGGSYSALTASNAAFISTCSAKD